MQFKSLFALATVATAAVATGIPPSQCTTGPIQCCQTVDKAGSDAVSKILGLLGVVVQDVNVLVGLTCNPIDIIGIGGNSCSAQPVCCSDNSFHGVVAVGCTPVDLNL